MIIMNLQIKFKYFNNKIMGVLGINNNFQIVGKINCLGSGRFLADAIRNDRTDSV